MAAILPYVIGNDKPLPMSYISLDHICCCFFLSQYLIKLYLAQHKTPYLFTARALIEAIVFIPVILGSLTGWSDKTYLFIFISFSRYVRVGITAKVLLRTIKLGKTEVDRQMYSIVILLLLLIYISSGIFTDVENQEKLKQAKEDGIENIQLF
jgi:acetyl-CoA C-acetyltransferase/potassium large conductance calcium-activated channel subfamily M alpha protein 1